MRAATWGAVIALAVWVAPVRAADPVPRLDPALRPELLALNDVTGDDTIRRAPVRLLKDRPRARRFVSEAVRLSKAEKPFRFTAGLILARTAHRVRLFDAGEYFYGQCIELAAKEANGPQLVLAYDGLVALDMDARRYAAVVAACDRFLDLDKPEEVRRVQGAFLQVQIRALALSGQTEPALAMAERLVVLNDGRWPALALKAFVLHEAGKTTAAVETYRQALAAIDTDARLDDAHKDADRDTVRTLLSTVLTEARDVDAATRELQILIQRHPEEPTYKNNLGFLWADNGVRLPEAEGLVREAIDLDRKRQQKLVVDEQIPEVRDSAAYLDSLGWVLFKQGKLADARASLERAAADEDAGDHLEIRDHLADCYLALGDKRKAVETWEAGLRLPDAGRADRERRKSVEAKLGKVRAEIKAAG